jgi:hypothetical protein
LLLPIKVPEPRPLKPRAGLTNVLAAWPGQMLAELEFIETGLAEPDADASCP